MTTQKQKRKILFFRNSSRFSKLDIRRSKSERQNESAKSKIFSNVNNFNPLPLSHSQDQVFPLKSWIARPGIRPTPLNPQFQPSGKWSLRDFRPARYQRLKLGVDFLSRHVNQILGPKIF